MTLDNLKQALILNNKLLLDRLKTFMHNHDNLPTLNGLSANEAGSLLFNGNIVNEQYAVTDEEIKTMVDQVIAELDKENGGSSENPASPVEFEWWSPQMTSANTPAPYSMSVSSTMNDSWEAWKCFNGKTNETGVNSGWYSKNCSSSNPQFVLFDYGSEVLIHGIKIAPGISNSGNFPAVFVVSGSNDNASWATLFTSSDNGGYTPADNTYRECMFEDNSTPYRYYKVDITATVYSIEGGTVDGTIIADIQFYKQKDV